MTRRDFLDTIIAHKQTEIEAARHLIPEPDLRQKAENHTRPVRSFANALKSDSPPNIKIIAEIKRASPSKGDININLDPATLARQYEQAGAAAVSVLTDRRFFKGSGNDLQQARQAVSLPVLRKDFIISAYQIYESVLLDADAILLIARILDTHQLSDHIALARELSLDTLVEVHSEADLNKATLAGADLIGINNRDLSSFDTDIGIAMHMMKLIRPDQTIVAASGIKDRADITKNKDHGIHCFLIGESIVRADDPVRFIQSLIG